MRIEQKKKEIERLNKKIKLLRQEIPKKPKNKLYVIGKICIDKKSKAEYTWCPVCKKRIERKEENDWVLAISGYVTRRVEIHLDCIDKLISSLKDFSKSKQLKDHIIKHIEYEKIIKGDD